MELSILSTLFCEKITSFPGSRPSHHLKAEVTQGYAVTYRTIGQRAFLFVTSVGSWLWNDEITQPLQMLTFCNHTYVFDVEFTKTQIVICDLLVYKNKVLTSRDQLERMEAARKWCHLYEGPKTVCGADDRSYKSAYPAYVLDFTDMTLSVKNLYPSFHRHHIWTSRPSAGVDGLFFTRLLDRYMPYKSTGILVWTPCDT
jgi:hypothetical protein